MSRFLYWSIYGGSILLAGLLIVATVMAVVGFVPFRSAQPLRASVADRDNSFAASLSTPPSHEVTRAVEARRDDSGDWDAVWQANSELTAAGMQRVAADEGIHEVGSTKVSFSEAAPHAEPDATMGRAGDQRADRSTPQEPVPPLVQSLDQTPDGPARDLISGALPVVAGLWPVVQPSPQPDPAIDEPADTPDDDPAGDDQRDAGGGDDGDTDREPDDREPSDGPLRLSLVPSHDEVSTGEIVSVQVVLSEADDVSGVPFHVRFNDEVLEFVGAKSGSALVSSSLQPILLASVNPARPDDLAVGLALVRSSGRFSGSGTVVVLNFRALQAGQSELQFEKVTVRDAHGRPLTVQIEGSALAVR